MSRYVDKCEVCPPIEKLLNYLKNKGMTVEEMRVEDYHFHELYVKISGNKNELTEEIKINKIKKVSDTIFMCECHWSIVAIEWRGSVLDVTPFA